MSEMGKGEETCLKLYNQFIVWSIFTKVKMGKCIPQKCQNYNVLKIAGGPQEEGLHPQMVARQCGQCYHRGRDKMVGGHREGSISLLQAELWKASSRSGYL